MCQYQDSGFEEEQQQQGDISQWVLSANTKVDGNHMRDLRHMCPKTHAPSGACVFGGVLDDRCRHFSNPLSPEASQVRYMDPKGVRLPGTRLGNMADKLACNEPLINVSVPRQWL